MLAEDHIKHNEETEKRIINDVKEFGCHFAILEETDSYPRVAYSIGFYQSFNHPEIICFGLSAETLLFLLNEAKKRIQEGEQFATDKLYSGFLEGHFIQFLNVDKSFYSDYLGYCMWFNQYKEFPGLQLVYPDLQGKFPWEKDFNTDWRFRQKLLDRDAHFHFYEDKNVGVYTTSDILQGAPILYVYHNTDGDWQFHSNANPNINEAKLVCLEEVVKLDPSINKLFYLERGFSAFRKSKVDQWLIAEVTE